jgi:hypothetical protein
LLPAGKARGGRPADRRPLAVGQVAGDERQQLALLGRHVRVDGDRHAGAGTGEGVARGNRAVDRPLPGDGDEVAQGVVEHGRPAGPRADGLPGGRVLVRRQAAEERRPEQLPLGRVVLEHDAGQQVGVAGR